MKRSRAGYLQIAAGPARTGLPLLRPAMPRLALPEESRPAAHEFRTAALVPARAVSAPSPLAPQALPVAVSRTPAAAQTPLAADPVEPRKRPKAPAERQPEAARPQPAAQRPLPRATEPPRAPALLDKAIVPAAHAERRSTPPIVAVDTEKQLSASAATRREPRPVPQDHPALRDEPVATAVLPPREPAREMRTDHRADVRAIDAALPHPDTRPAPRRPAEPTIRIGTIEIRSSPVAAPATQPLPELAPPRRGAQPTSVPAARLAHGYSRSSGPWGT